MAEIAALCRESAPDRATYTAVLELIQPLVAFDAATLFVMDGSRKRLEECATLNQPVEVLGFLKMGHGDGLAGWIAQDGKPILLSARNETEGFDPETDFATVLAVPLRIADCVIGVLSVGCHKPKALADKQVRLLTVIGDQLAVTMERRQFEQKLLRQHEELAESERRLKTVQRQLIAQERLAGVASLATDISHQINNPLAVIVGNAQCLLLEQDGLTQKAVSRLQRIEEAALRIRDINRRLRQVNTIVEEIQPPATGDPQKTPEPQGEPT
ncbi:MAG: GAF domain-containing protein [candidate division Zixibacteria bacterium]|nr:GAF domain-containing protein [candidate division Zixibacteria bacterium]